MISRNTNNKNSDRKFILSIETAVEGGSLSILADHVEIDGWTGIQQISKAEDVLEQISKLLEKNNILKEQVKLVAVAKGAGSLTGEKIGLALARGLAKSLKCQLVEISVFESLLLEISERLEGEYLTAIPVGKDQIQWQNYIAENGTFYNKNNSPQISTRDEFFNTQQEFIGKHVVLAVGFHELYDQFIPNFGYSQVTISSNSLAKLNGLATSKMRPIMNYQSL